MCISSCGTQGVELVLYGSVEPLADAVGLRALAFILEWSYGLDARYSSNSWSHGAAVTPSPGPVSILIHLEVVLLKERHDAVVEHVGGDKGILTVVQFGEADFG